MSRLPPVSAHVLVIEDDPDIRRDMVALLEGETGMEALEILDEGPEPCLALLDLMMPVMSGWELLEILQGNAELSHIPVVIVSAMNAPGACEHLAKPIDLDRLLATVSRLTA